MVAHQTLTLLVGVRISHPQPYGALVQLVRTPPCHGGGHEFKSRMRRQYAGVSEQVDESDLKSAVGINVRVRIPSPAPYLIFLMRCIMKRNKNVDPMLEMKREMWVRIEEAKKLLNLARQEESLADEEHLDVAIERVGIAMNNLNSLYKQAKLI